MQSTTIDPVAHEASEGRAPDVTRRRRIALVLLAGVVASVGLLAVLEPDLEGAPIPNYVSSDDFDVDMYEATFDAGPVCSAVDQAVLAGTVECEAYDTQGGWPFALLTLAIAGLGVALVLRWDNPIGWLLLAAALVDRAAAAARSYALQADVVDPGSLPLGVLAAFVGSVAWVGLLVVIVPRFLLTFPTGRVPSPAWRWVVRLTWVVATAIGLVVTFSPMWLGAVPNPLRLSWSVSTSDGIFGMAMLGMLACWALGGLAVVVRGITALRRRLTA